MYNEFEQKNRERVSLAFLLFIVLFAFNDLFQYSGYGQSLNWTSIISIVWAWVVIYYTFRNRETEFKPILFTVILLGTFLTFMFFVKAHKLGQFTNIFFSIIIVPVTIRLSWLSWSEKKLKLCGLALMLYTAFMIFSFQPGGLLSGWNPNSPIIVSSAGFCAACMAMQASGKLYKTLIALLAIWVISMIWSLGNRSAVLACLLFVIVCILRLHARGKATFRIFYCSVFALNLGLPFFNKYLISSDVYNFIQASSARWFDKDTASSGRDILWETAASRIKGSPLFGSGGTRPFYSHNMSTDILMTLGIAGWILFFVGVVFLLERAFVEGSRANIFLYAFVLLIFINCFENVMICNDVMCTFPLLLIAIPLSIKRRNQQLC